MSLSQLCQEMCENRTVKNDFNIDNVSVIYNFFKEKGCGEETSLSFCRDYMLFRDQYLEKLCDLYWFLKE